MPPRFTWDSYGLMFELEKRRVLFGLVLNDEERTLGHL